MLVKGLDYMSKCIAPLRTNINLKLSMERYD